jgi:TonB family protein
MILRHALLLILCLVPSAICQQSPGITPEEAARHLLKKVDPVYPPMGKQLHIQGDAIIQIAISETGAVKILKAISGSPILMPAAMDAIQQWQYSPFLVDGKPSAVQTTVTVPFSLGGSPEKIKKKQKYNMERQKLPSNWPVRTWTLLF